MPKVTLNSGLKLHYQQIGDGPDLVMIHGITGNLAVWHLKIIPLLWDHFRITTYDLRGHGYSDVPPNGYTLDQMALDLAELLDSLEIREAALVGHSFGADLSLYFAHHYPERVKRVIAIEAALPAMIEARSHDGWEGWRYWSDVLERPGIEVRRTAAPIRTICCGSASRCQRSGGRSTGCPAIRSRSCGCLTRRPSRPTTWRSGH